MQTFPFEIEYYNVYFGKDGNRLILLLIGGDKSSQRRDIETAVTYLQDHEARKQP